MIEWIFILMPVWLPALVLGGMTLYSRKVQRDIAKLEKQNEYLTNMQRNKVSPQVYQAPKRHGKTVVSKRYLRQEAIRQQRTTRPGDDSSIINPTNIALAAVLLSNHDTPASAPDCSPSSDSGSSYDSGSSSCDSGGGDFGGGN